MYTVLITEDDENLRDNLQHILSLEGYKVHIAKNGLDAYEKILIYTTDLIISDIQMPYVNGFEF